MPGSSSIAADPLADALREVAVQLPQSVKRRLLAEAKREVKARQPKTAKQKARERILASIREGMIEAKEIAAGRMKARPIEEFLKELEGE